MALLVTGHQRSGTTLLRRLLEQHPDVSMARELGSFLRLGAPYGAYMRRMLVRWGGILTRGERSLATNVVGYAGLKTVFHNQLFMARYLQAVRRRHPARVDVPTIEAALRAVLPEARVVGDKYPEYVFALDELAPARGLTVVVIYRDCRDVVSSTLRKIHGDWRSMPFFIRKIDTPAKIARRWQRAVRAMKRQAPHVLTLRYEAFVQEKRESLEALGHWIGVDPDGFDAGMIKTSSIGKYKEHLSAEAVRTVEEIAGPLMAELGYR